MTIILYIILGLSLGIGLTLIYLQERFIRERRLLVAMGESERAKSSKLIKDLDVQWESECEQYKREIEEYKKELAQIEHDHSSKEVITVQDTEKITTLGKQLKTKEDDYTKLLQENKDLKKSITPLQEEISEHLAEIDFLKGEIEKLKEANNKKSELVADEDFLVLANGGHLLPGSIARALMKENG